MKAKLVVDNREIEVEISEEELDRLSSKQEKKTGYERVEFGYTHYFGEICGTLGADEDRHEKGDDQFYESANYYSDKTIAINNIRADKLMRRLRRFAVEHRKHPLDWDVNNNQRKYSIYYGTNDIFEDPELKIDCCFEDRYFGIIYFDTREAARKAIEIFHDELIWYFTEYKDSL